MFWSIRRFILGIPYRVRSLRFRLTHGFPMEDCWALDDATGKFLAPRLRYLAEHHAGHPSLFDGEDGDELWTAILYKMADGFDLIAREDWIDEGKFAYCEECLGLFQEFFFSLWD
jgi:hypothetical protein